MIFRTLPVIFLLLASVFSLGANWSVTNAADEGDVLGTLRHAVNNSASGDSIFISPLVSQIDLGSPLIVQHDLVLLGTGPSSSILNGFGVGLVQVQPDVSFHVYDVSVNGGFTSSNLSGGITGFDGSEIQCIGVDFTNNQAIFQGGAIAMRGLFSRLIVQDCYFNNNTTYNGGGTIYADSTTDITLSYSVFEAGSDENVGGAILLYRGSGGGSSLKIDHCHFNNNYSSNVGGVLSLSGAAECSIESSLFQENVSQDGGGAIYAQGGSSVAISNSTFFLNETMIGDGGAILLSDFGNSAVTNCTFVQNSAIGSNSTGGGIVTEGSGQLSLQNSVFFQNSSTLSSGSGALHQNSGTQILSEGGNFISISGGPNGFSPLASDFMGTANAPLDPQLEGIDFFGGFTVSFVPQCGSPLVNAGVNTGISGVDQRGEPRISEGRVDIGATEQQGTFQNLVVTNTNNAGCGSLRYWIDNAVAGDTITFDPALSGATIYQYGTGYAVNTSITIQGDSTNPITLDGEGFAAHFSVGFLVDFAASDLNLINGLSGTGGGGAVSMTQQGSSCTFKRVRFENNRADVAGLPANGGAIFTNSASALFLDECQFINNYAKISGGAIFTLLDPGANNLIIENCLFENNECTNVGGAIYHSGPNLNLIKSTLVGNRALNGGGVYLGGFTADLIEQCTFTQNTATGAGGAIALEDFQTAKSVAVIASTIVGNTAVSGGGIKNGNSATVRIESSVLAENVASDPLTGNDIYESGSGSVSASYALIGDTTTINPTFFFDVQVGTLTNPLPAEVEPLADNGGLTPTMAPTFPGALIDAGFFTSDELDQRNAARISGIGNDIGAVEYQYPCDTFSVTHYFNNGSCGTLEFALEQANVTPGVQTIDFSQMDSSNIYISTKDLIISEEIMLDGTSHPAYVDRPVLSLIGFQGDEDGFQLNLDSFATGSTIKGFIFEGFGDESLAVIRIDGADSVTIQHNFFGYDRYGEPQEEMTQLGIWMNESLNSRIGGDMATEGNRFAGFTTGIVAGLSDNLRVQGNFFGTSVDGVSSGPEHALTTAAIISECDNVTMGGGNSRGNVFGHMQEGLDVNLSSGGLYRNNRFGISPLGILYNLLPSGFAEFGSIKLGVVDGAKVVENQFFSQDVGVWLEDADSCVVKDNRFGVNASGVIQANGGNVLPIALQVARHNTIGPGNIIANSDTMALFAVNNLADGNFGNRLTKNSIFCNDGEGIVFNGQVNFNHPAPLITNVGSSEITGSGIPGDSIEVFMAGLTCPSDFSHGETYVGSALVDADSTWSLGGVFNPYVDYAVTADSLGNTSPYSLFQVPCDTFLVTSSADDRTCGTLRFALEQANADPDLDTISFDLQYDSYLIELASPLNVNNAVLIDGMSDPASVSRPVVRLSPDSDNLNTINGLEVFSTGSSIEGLVFNGFSHAINLDDATGNVVDFCVFGLDSAGTGLGMANSSAIAMSSSTQNIIINNDIANSSIYGVYGFESSETNIFNNRFGTLVGDTLSNAGNEYALYFESVSDETWIAENDIRFSRQPAISFDDSWTCTIENNVIVDGDTTAIYNNLSNENVFFGNRIMRNQGDGMYFFSGQLEVIGDESNPNLISENAGHGVNFEGLSSDHYVSSNQIVENGGHGIKLGPSVNTTSLRLNYLSCNDSLGIELLPGANGDPFAPVITFASDSLVEGKATPGSLVDVFYADKCNNEEGSAFIDSVTASVDSSWSISGIFQGNIYVTAMSTTSIDTILTSSKFGNADWIIGCEDTPVAFDTTISLVYLDSFDIEIPFDTAQYIQIESFPTNGDAILVNDSTVRYVSTLPFTGNDTVVFGVVNSCDEVALGEIVISLSCPDAPVAEEIVSSVIPKGTTTFDLGFDTTAFSLSLLSTPLLGSAFIENGNEIIYSPAFGITGRDSIEYAITNFCGADSVNFLKLDVQCGPELEARNIDTVGEAGIDILFALNRDTAVYSLSILESPNVGIAQVNTAGQLRYISTALSLVPDEITYTITSICGEADTAVIEIDLSCDPTPEPEFLELDVATFERFDITINMDQDLQTLGVVSGPSNGTAIADSNTIRYQSNSGYEGLDEITYRLTDDCGRERIATITLTVAPQQIEVSTTIGVTNTILIEVPKNTDPTSFNVLNTPFGTILAKDIENGNLILEYEVEAGLDTSDIIYYQVCDFEGNCIEREIINTVQEPLEATTDIFADVLETISPNNDGANEFMLVSLCSESTGECRNAVEGYEIHLIVFDGWGNEVYQSEDYQNDPDTGFYGQSKSVFGETSVQDGVYYWVVELWNSNERLKIDRQTGFLVVKSN